jgi:hypothetical protein
MSEPFVATLRTTGDAISISPDATDAITLRVEMPEVWDTVKVRVAPGNPVSAVKSAALGQLFPGAMLADFVLKLHGWEVLDETASVRDTGAVNGSIFLLTNRKRRPVR